MSKFRRLKPSLRSAGYYTFEDDPDRQLGVYSIVGKYNELVDKMRILEIAVESRRLAIGADEYEVSGFDTSDASEIYSEGYKDGVQEVIDIVQKELES